jgi:hypothetical protein
MSDVYQSLTHSKWDCKYHVVFVPKRRRKAIFGQTRRQLGAIFHALARQKECQILEGHLMPDHVHMCISIPPKHPVASVIEGAGVQSGADGCFGDSLRYRLPNVICAAADWEAGAALSAANVAESRVGGRIGCQRRVAVRRRVPHRECGQQGGICGEDQFSGGDQQYGWSVSVSVGEACGM